MKDNKLIEIQNYVDEYFTFSNRAVNWPLDDMERFDLFYEYADKLAVHCQCLLNSIGEQNASKRSS